MLSSATRVSANLSEHYINCEPTTRFLVDVVNIGQTIKKLTLFLCLCRYLDMFNLFPMVFLLSKIYIFFFFFLGGGGGGDKILRLGRVDLFPPPKKRDSRHIVTKNIACKVEV